MKGITTYRAGKGAESLTTLISVSLLLLIAGIAGALAMAGRNETQRLRESLEMTLVMADSVSDAQAAQLAAMLRQKPYVAAVKASTRDEALAAWQKATGEDLKAVYGVNPLSPEITLRLRAEYASPQQMQTLAGALEQLPEVEGVAMPQTEFVEGMNRTLTRIIWGLAALCAGLVAISMVLINNMVHGVTEGYSKKLEINGVGYRASKEGNKLVMNLGYSHLVTMEEIEGITIDVPAPNKVVINGIDKQKVGQFAANVRGKRPPEPYKGKGIKYATETIRHKEGKAGGKK